MVTDMQVQSSTLKRLGLDAFQRVAQLDARDSKAALGLNAARLAPRACKIISDTAFAYRKAHTAAQSLSGPLATAYWAGVAAGVDFDVVWTDEPSSPRGERVQSPS